MRTGAEEVMPKKANLQDVAKAAGVSVATVSRVANGLDTVTPALRDKVIQAALQLGIDLRQKSQFNVIAFLLSNRGVLHPFHSSVLVGAEAHCALHGYALLFVQLEYGLHVPAENLFVPGVLENRHLTRGVIVAGTNAENLLHLLDRQGIPIVVLGNNVVGAWQPDNYDTVFFDDIDGTKALTRYLLSLGHKRILFVGNCKLPWFLRRFEGYRAAIEEAGLEVLLGDIDSPSPEEIGYLATKSVLDRSHPISAVIAGEDAAARGVYRAVADKGLRIPEHISVAGFNDTLEASALSPPLTSVHVFTEQLGKQLAQLLMNRVAHPGLGPKTLMLPTRLVKRESCAPPRLESIAAPPIQAASAVL